jgi:NAD(P)H-dependent FMN reductase
MIRTAMVTGSTRPGRNGLAVAQWVYDVARERERPDVQIELVDIADYNHGTSAALRNAIDYLHAEWADKAAGFVGYGAQGGVRAVEQLRLVLAELQVATVRAQVALSLFTDFEAFRTPKPASHQAERVHALFDQVVRWAGALKALRAPSDARDAA